MTCRDFRKYISAYVDHEVGVERALELEEHIQACERCKRSLELERWSADLVRQCYPQAPCPTTLEGRIRAVLARPRRLWPVVTATTAVVAAGLLLWFATQLTRTEASLPRRVAVAAELYDEWVRGRLVLSARADEASALDEWLARQLAFYPPGALRAPHGFTPVGVKVVKDGGDQFGVVVYRSENGPALLLIAARQSEPKRPRREADAAGFLRYARGNQKLISWNHGPLSYVLVSRGTHDGAQACGTCHSGVRSDRLADFPGRLGATEGRGNDGI
ncbi:MAG: hypothetical protein KatS3mg077_1355 [Candidatus Binatia bacterium]|nr:MAG: hypothetical protein KatS3mg077_1355 [Candidatus Binatia bacterium]